MKKRIIMLFTTVILLTVLLPTTVFAHGHNQSGNSSQNTVYGLCTNEDCHMADVHKHEGTYYSGHTLDDGHDYHQVCTVQDCTETVIHEHDGLTCFPHDSTNSHVNRNSRHRSRGCR